jgi:hypothetical protein
MSLLFNNMLTTSNATFQNLLKTYSICPPSDPGFTADTKVQNTVGGAKVNRADVNTGVGSTDPRLQNSATNSVEMRKISKTNAKVFIDLNPYPLQTAPGAVKGAEGGNTLYFNVTPGPTANYAPIWFLPWRTGSALRLTIPAAGGIGANPDIFFTAAINGCSIFFQGTPQNPTITHCGGNTGFAEQQLNEGADFWEAVMDEFMAADAAVGKNKGALHGSTVDKRDYVAQPGFSKTTKQGLKKSTARAKAYEQQLKTQVSKGRVRIKEVSPWGCVLGRRDAAGDWIFYLQENATVAYYELTSKNPYKALKGTNKSVISRVSIPMVYREVFPGGHAHATILPTLPKIV